MRLRWHNIIATLALGSMGTALAGTVHVSFVDPARYTDAGNTPTEARNNLAALARHLEEVGQRTLPGDQVLRVQVLDVDLAGQVRDAQGVPVRVLGTDAPPPQVRLRYTLEAQGRPVAGNEERVSGPTGASTRTSTTAGTPDPLRREKQLLEHWLRERFGRDAQASG